MTTFPQLYHNFTIRLEKLRNDKTGLFFPFLYYIIKNIIIIYNITRKKESERVYPIFLPLSIFPSHTRKSWKSGKVKISNFNLSVFSQLNGISRINAMVKLNHFLVCGGKVTTTRGPAIMTHEVVFACWSCLHRWKGPLVEENAGRCPACGGVRITFVSSPGTVIPKPSRRQGRRSP